MWPRLGNYKINLPAKILPWKDKYSGSRDGRGIHPYRCEKLDVLGALGVEIVCLGVTDGISNCSKDTPVCVTSPTHISVPSCYNFVPHPADTTPSPVLRTT